MKERIIQDIEDILNKEREPILRRSYGKYVEYFRGSEGMVLDIGCGNGIMLEFLKGAAVNAYGVDNSDISIKNCIEKGLKVVKTDALEHLRSLPEGFLGGVFISHFLEHLTFEKAIEVLQEIYRILRERGKIVLITPNPEDIIVLAVRFWLDPTHVRLYPDKLIRVMFKEIGFSDVSIMEDSDTMYSHKSLFRNLAGRLRKIWLWGRTNRGDIVVVGRK
jgi:O-antigen chain-terminating methyltransferase